MTLDQFNYIKDMTMLICLQKFLSILSFQNKSLIYLKFLMNRDVVNIADVTSIDDNYYVISKCIIISNIDIYKYLVTKLNIGKEYIPIVELFRYSSSHRGIELIKFTLNYFNLSKEILLCDDCAPLKLLISRKSYSLLFEMLRRYKSTFVTEDFINIIATIDQYTELLYNDKILEDIIIYFRIIVKIDISIAYILKHIQYDFQNKYRLQNKYYPKFVAR